MFRSMYVLAMFFAGAFCGSAQAQTAETPPQSPRRYGSVRVEKITTIDRQDRIICDIEGWPAIVGADIPVEIRGIETDRGRSFAPAVRKFILDTLRAALQKPPVNAGDPNRPAGGVVLREIERGDSFCLTADIEIAGKDLGQMLIEQGYARKTLRMEASAVQPTPLPRTTGAKTSTGVAGIQQETHGEYAGSKSGRVFHKTTCPHARRIQQDSLVTFSSRQEAIDSGRRPCKTCNP